MGNCYTLLCKISLKDGQLLYHFVQDFITRCTRFHYKMGNCCTILYKISLQYGQLLYHFLYKISLQDELRWAIAVSFCTRFHYKMGNCCTFLNKISLQDGQLLLPFVQDFIKRWALAIPFCTRFHFYKIGNCCTICTITRWALTTICTRFIYKMDNEFKTRPFVQDCFIYKMDHGSTICTRFINKIGL